MTVLQQFSNELAAAAQRQARRETVVHRRARITGLAVAGVLMLGGVAAATTIWQPQLGGNRRGTPTASLSAPPADQLAEFGVLRRAPTAGDHGAQSTYALRFLDPSLHGVRTDYVRLLGTQANGEAFVLVPVQSYAAQDGEGPSITDALCLFSQDVDGGGLGCFSTQQILDGRAVESMGRPKPLAIAPSGATVTASGRSHFQRVRGVTLTDVVYFGLVPDGVTSIKLTSDQGSVTVPVHDNFFQAPLPGGETAAPDHSNTASTPTFEWLDPTGKVITTPVAPGT